MLGSWGGYPRAVHTVHPLHWRHRDLLPASGQSLLAYGQGRSYGDSCLNDGGTLLLTAGLNRFIAFDRRNGLLRCEAGVTLAEMLRVIVPSGWFLPVAPGTKFVSVGGAVANDIHGKNHHRAGSFGNHVRQLELLRSNGERIICSTSKNPDWFTATLGGLGLTGLILWVEIQLKPVPSPWMSVETIKFFTLGEFYALAADSETDFEYTVAWLDCASRGRSFGRGLFMRANHSKEDAKLHPAPSGKFSVPFNAPDWLLNQYSIRAFNELYFNKQRRVSTHQTTHFDQFFFPLDGIDHWNRIYGKRGFLQYQCVVTGTAREQAITEILERIAASQKGSFLSVLKTFGDISSAGMLSFPRQGITLALDFPNRGAATFALLDELDELVGKHSGAVYPAKDARMSARAFDLFYPRKREFLPFIDPRFSSSFWRRVNARPTTI